MTPGRITLADEGTVAALARAVDPGYRALVLLLRYTGLRWPEVVALRRRHCHLPGGNIEVTQAAQEVAGEVWFRKLRAAGWVSVRDEVKDALALHLELHVPRRPAALVFSDGEGRPLFRLWFHTHIWRPALEAIGLDVEDTGDVEVLTTAQLWVAVHEASAQRRSLTEAWGAGRG